MNWIKRAQSLLIISTLSLLSSCSFLVLAQSDDEFVIKLQKSERFFYFGAKGGWVNYQNACQPTAISCDENDSAWGSFIGYQFHKNWAVETAYNDFGQAVALYPENELVNEYIGKIKGWELSLIGYLPLNEQIDLFTKVGTLKWDGKNTGPYSTRSDSDWGPMAGIGLEYKLTKSWVARVEYQYFNSVGSDLIGGSNIHLTSIGLSYRFGQVSN